MSMIAGNFKVLPPAEAEHLIRHVGRIPIVAFRVTLGVFAGLAFLCVCARLVIRGLTWRRLYVDDGFLIFALICMIVATVLILKYCFLIFCVNAMYLIPEETTLYVTQKVGLEQLENTDAYIYPYLAMAWTATFSVKWSFFAFFRPMIRNVSQRLTIYYWSCVSFSVVTWAFLMGEPFILCHYFGAEGGKCYPIRLSLSLGMTTLIAMLDTLSDITIMSIPIIILYKAQLKLSTKFGLCAFLCLSIFMCFCSLIRIGGYTWHHTTDLTWSLFWQQLEASTAVSMASITVFRSIFVASNRRLEEGQERSPLAAYFHKLRQRFWSTRSIEYDDSQDRKRQSPWRLPTIPGATITGIRTFIGGGKRGEMKNTGLASELSMFETDYHAHLKRPDGIWVKRSWEQKSQYGAASTEAGQRTEQRDVV